jgi:hypothetical protein
MLTPLACALMELKRSLRDFVPKVCCVPWNFPLGTWAMFPLRVWTEPRFLMHRWEGRRTDLSSACM